MTGVYVGSWGNVPLFGALADQSAMMTGTGLPVDTGHTAAAAAVGMHVGYPTTMNMNDVSAMMMMSDVYHGNPPAIDQSAVKHMLHSVTNLSFVFIAMTPVDVSDAMCVTR